MQDYRNEKMYESEYIVSILEALYNSEYFCSEGEKLIAIRTLMLLIDAFSLDEYSNSHNFTEAEYKIYYKDILKKYNPRVNKKVKKQFKKKRK